MFVRFRQSAARLNLSLVETRRVDGKVKHEHIAGLGSITLPPGVADRIDFWAHLHERFAQLSGRIKPEALGKILADIHSHVPMVTLEEQVLVTLGEVGVARKAVRPARVTRAVLRKHAGGKV